MLLVSSQKPLSFIYAMTLTHQSSVTHAVSPIGGVSAPGSHVRPYKERQWNSDPERGESHHRNCSEISSSGEGISWQGFGSTEVWHGQGNWAS